MNDDINVFIFSLYTQTKHTRNI